MHKKTTINFDYDLENSCLYLSCAIKNLNLLRDEISKDILTEKKAGISLGTGHIEECLAAMFTAIRELERIQADMDAAIDAAYTRGD